VFNWETLGAVIHNGHGVQLVVFCTTWAVSRILGDMLLVYPGRDKSVDRIGEEKRDAA